MTNTQALALVMTYPHRLIEHKGCRGNAAGVVGAQLTNGTIWWRFDSTNAIMPNIKVEKDAVTSFYDDVKSAIEAAI